MDLVVELLHLLHKGFKILLETCVKVAGLVVAHMIIYLKHTNHLSEKRVHVKTLHFASAKHTFFVNKYIFLLIP